jgi:LysM repeat protein
MAGQQGGWLERAQAAVTRAWSGEPGRVRAAGHRRSTQAMPAGQYRPASTPVEHWSQRRQLSHYTRPARRSGDHNVTTMVIVIVVITMGVGLLYAVSSWINAGSSSRTAQVVATPSPAAATVPVPAAVGSPLPSPQPVVLGSPQPVVIGGPSPSAEAVPGARRTYKVAAGDTLAKIAAQYGTTIDAIMRANNITDRGRILRVGEDLVIPAP